MSETRVFIFELGPAELDKTWLSSGGPTRAVKARGTGTGPGAELDDFVEAIGAGQPPSIFFERAVSVATIPAPCRATSVMHVI